MPAPVSAPPAGVLVAIGGAEDKTRDLEILRGVLAEASAADGGAEVTVIASASRIPEQVLPDYVAAFGAIGAARVNALEVRDRTAASEPPAIAAVRRSSAIFLTGGDQTRLTSILGGSDLLDAIVARYAGGAVVAGTSAGAAAMSAAMIAGGPAEDALYRDVVRMSTGLGFVDGLVFDTHFLERGRFTRLMAMTAANPGTLGVGIGEDAAVLLRGGSRLEVLGPGHVAVVDGRAIASTNAADADSGAPIAVEGVVVHALIQGYVYDAVARRVIPPAPRSGRHAA